MQGYCHKSYVKVLSLQGFYDLFCHRGLVHGVDMNAVHAVFPQIQNLTDGIVDACLSHILRAVAIGGYQIRKGLGDAGA